MADPEFVGPFLVPRHAALRSEDFQAEAVLAAGRDLAGGEGAAGAAAHAEQNAAEILGIDRGFDVVLRAEFLPGEGFDGALGLLTSFMEGLKVGADAGDALAADVFGHVTPVGADIGHAA